MKNLTSSVLNHYHFDIGLTLVYCQNRNLNETTGQLRESQYLKYVEMHCVWFRVFIDDLSPTQLVYLFDFTCCPHPKYWKPLTLKFYQKRSEEILCFKAKKWILGEMYFQLHWGLCTSNSQYEITEITIQQKISLSSLQIKMKFC